MSNSPIDPIDLKLQLSQFIGTEIWHRHGLNRHLLMTDGFIYFAETVGGYWFADWVGIVLLPRVMREMWPFVSISLNVNGSKAEIIVTDGNDLRLLSERVSFTDCPEGNWKFFLTDSVLMLPSEY